MFEEVYCEFLEDHLVVGNVNQLLLEQRSGIPCSRGCQATKQGWSKQFPGGWALDKSWPSGQPMLESPGC